METVLLTGAAGSVAAQIRPHLRARYRLRLADLRTPAEPPTSGEELLVDDLSDPEVTARALAGAAAVVHLAGVPNFDADWATLEPANVGLTEQVLRAAHGAGAAHVVLASSVHAAGGYARDGATPVDPGWPSHPCCLYGASKAALESLGDVYAHVYGLSVSCLRIGWAIPRPRHPLARTVWVSPRDLAHLVDRAITTRPRYGVYFGVSANTRGAWRIDNAGRELDYRPVDNAEDYAGEMDHEMDHDAEEEPTWLHRARPNTKAASR